MLSIFVRTVILFILLSITMKIMGKRQLGELEVGELIVTLLVSEVAAVPIGDPDVPLLASIIPIIFLTCTEVALAAAKSRSNKLKSIMEGEPTYLIYRGKLRQDALADNRVTVTELLSEMRSQSIPDLSRVYYAILESNGKFSFVTRDGADELTHTVMIDGECNEKRLRELGYDGQWLRRTLDREGVKNNEVFLMTVTDSGTVNIIRKEEKN